ncbi:cell division protein FtsZ [Ktedonosporobacter rubrisoli]|nr:cell division protein FtsZ [Ktedonosporobacter rubrisoli]
MQPMSHDAYKRDLFPEEWAEQVRVRPNVYEEQADQWAVLRHEVEGEHQQWQEEGFRPDWEQRDTDVDTVSSYSSADALAQAQHHVDIVVVGVGGGGMNAVNRMIHTGVRGVRYIAMNTDAQVLALSQARDRICLGQHHTKGLGAGGNAAVGTRAATESAAEIRAALGDADMVFIAAGMGGGTGTGAAPVVASIAKKLGALTIGIVTLPFMFEGTRRRRVADQGLHELKEEIDALITVPNDRLLTTVARDQSLSDAFKVADDVLRQGVQGIAEVINVPGMINVDFADVRSVLREAGTALMSLGLGQGRNRAQRAAEEAIAGGFLNVTIRGAKRVLFNISGGEDMTLFEVNDVAERIGAAIDSAADITFGAVIDPSLHDTIHVTLIAAGMEEALTTRLPAVRPEQFPQPRLTSPRSVPTPAAPMTPLTPPIRPISQTRVPPSTQMPPATRLPSTPGRQQRSLNDLRGIRSMGRRQERLNKYPGDHDDEGIDIPPFLKRYE